jgi:hypothetical protein
MALAALAQAQQLGPSPSGVPAGQGQPLQQGQQRPLQQQGQVPQYASPQAQSSQYPPQYQQQLQYQPQQGQQYPQPQYASQPMGQPMPQVPPLPNGIRPAKPGEGLTPEAFAAIVNGQLPLSPAQVREVKKHADSVKRATVSRLGPAPLPVSSTGRVSLNAGANPHVLRLSMGTVTTVVVTDVTGAPWNVVNVVAGAKDLLDIPKDEPGIKSNMFTISPTDEYVSTNIAVFLEGAPGPITMAVETNQREVDFRFDAVVQARGPAAVTPVISRGYTDSIPADLTAMVAGVTPPEAKALKVLASDVPEVQAWVVGKRMYVRSRANVLAPPVPRDGKVASGADGTKVYELPLAPEVLLMHGGTVGRLRLGGFPSPAVTLAPQTMGAAPAGAVAR